MSRAARERRATHELRLRWGLYLREVWHRERAAARGRRLSQTQNDPCL